MNRAVGLPSVGFLGDMLTAFFDLVNASFDHSYERLSLPGPFMVGSTINERQMSGMSDSLSMIRSL